ncbi:6658_t:CDS:2, partial [Cetraspora pellucida]
IILDDQAFTVLKNPKFQDMLKYLQPNIQIPLANTIKQDLNKSYKKSKQDINQNLQYDFDNDLENLKDKDPEKLNNIIFK